MSRSSKKSIRFFKHTNINILRLLEAYPREIDFDFRFEWKVCIPSGIFKPKFYVALAQPQTIWFFDVNGKQPRALLLPQPILDPKFPKERIGKGYNHSQTLFL